VYLAEPDQVGKARLKERQLKTSSVIALTVVASGAKMNDSGHDLASVAKVLCELS